MRDYTTFIPEYVAAGAAILIITVELLWPTLRKDVLAYMTAFAAAGWAIASAAYIGMEPRSFQGLLELDNFTTYFRFLAAGIIFVTALMSATYMRDRAKATAEYYGLMLIAGIGMVYMAAARELITAYISLELLSFCLYVLVGYLKRDALSSEASLKYILLGAFSSAMFLYGMSLIYGVAGTTSYDGIASALDARGAHTDAAVIVGFMLILAGVGFKVSAVPFHMWAPDAYEGAPLPITAFLSTLSKAAGFGLILRLFSGAFITDALEWRWAFAALAAITMTGGNLMAIQQSNLKRLVAYSSIGQVGYMLVVIAAIGYGDAEVGRNATSGLLLHITGLHRLDAGAVHGADGLLQQDGRRHGGRTEGTGGDAAVPRAGDHGVAVLVRGAAVLRGVRDEAVHVPGSDDERASLADRARDSEQLHQPLLLPDDRATDVPVRPGAGPRAVPGQSAAVGTWGGADARCAVHRRVPGAGVPRGVEGGEAAVRTDGHGQREGRRPAVVRFVARASGPEMTI